MASFKIIGGKKLKGDISPQGAKNEALQVLCATLLTKEEVKISNLPDIIDINKLIEILVKLGVKVKKLKKNSFSFTADDLDLSYLNTRDFIKKCKELRGSVMIIGPLISRFGSALMPRPGGDKIGRRRLDIHFKGIEQLGANFKYDDNKKIYYVHAKKLIGKDILLDEASVTGTANLIMSACLANGITQIYNAACEPYIQQLCKMINVMGGKISGIGSNLLKIDGVKKLSGCSHRILPDMIEIGSWIGLAAMTNSEIKIKNVSIENLGLIPRTFEKIGIKIIYENDDIIIPSQKNYEIESFIDGSIMTISDSPWPGFTPDLLSIILVIATQAKGSVLIHQKMFESRLFFTDKLIDMGAKIILCDPHRATVIGLNKVSKLKSTTMTSPDIRAGIALLIAALSADGESVIHNIEQIDRGYERIEERLIKIGANIKRIN
tara:strand:+ start:1053 stop:2360 length:1308 start_codon:yes stop_codon:yes gene_type:complete